MDSISYKGSGFHTVGGTSIHQSSLAGKSFLYTIVIAITGKDLGEA